MKEEKIKLLGKVSWILSQIIRYLILLILLTISGVVTAGVGTLIALIFYEACLKIIPFNISTYKNYQSLIKEEISPLEFRKFFERKRIYNFLTYGILSLLSLFTFTKEFAGDNKIVGTVIFSICLSFLLFTIFYFRKLNTFMNLNYPEWREKKEKKHNSENQNKSYKNLNLKINKERSLIIKDKFIKSTKSLTEKEIIIIAILLGTITFSLASYLFGTDAYFYKGTRVLKGRRFDFKEFELNYIIGIIGFITSFGLTYIFLSKQKVE